MNSKARVCIGLPVYNGEKYLAETFESILSQQYTDFMLIVSDNASTDKTQEICRKYASQDNRIVYNRSKKNLGASMNFNRVFKLFSTEYFKWASYDDILAPDFLIKCVNILDNDPSVVICHSKTARINEYGSLVGNYDHRNMANIASSKIHYRFRDLISVRNPCWAIFGLFRTESLVKTKLMGNYIGADRNLLAEIGLIGKIYEIPEYLFFRRDHPEAYTRKFCEKPYAVAWDNYSEQMTYWTKDGFFKFPNLKNLIEYVWSVRSVPMKITDRFLCYKEILNWFFKEGFGYISNDIENALLKRSIFGRNFFLILKHIQNNIRKVRIK